MTCLDVGIGYASILFYLGGSTVGFFFRPWLLSLSLSLNHRYCLPLTLRSSFQDCGGIYIAIASAFLLFPLLRISPRYCGSKLNLRFLRIKSTTLPVSECFRQIFGVFQGRPHLFFWYSMKIARHSVGAVSAKISITKLTRLEPF